MKEFYGASEKTHVQSWGVASAEHASVTASQKVSVLHTGSVTELHYWSYHNNYLYFTNIQRSNSYQDPLVFSSCHSRREIKASQHIADSMGWARVLLRCPSSENKPMGVPGTSSTPGNLVFLICIWGFCASFCFMFSQREASSTHCGFCRIPLPPCPFPLISLSRSLCVWTRYSYRKVLGTPHLKWSQSTVKWEGAKKGLCPCFCAKSCHTSTHENFGALQSCMEP